MTANGETEEHKRKTNDPFLKQQGGHHSMPRSPRLCTPIRNNWPEIFPNHNVIGNQDSKGLSRYITSLAGSEHPSTSFCSTTNPQHSVEEQTQRNQLAIESKYNSLRRDFAPKVDKQIPRRLSKGLKGIDSEFWGLKFLSSTRKEVNHEPQKVFASNISNIDKTIASCNAHLISSEVKITSSTSNYPQLIVEKAGKGKGVIYKDLDKRLSLRSTLMSQEDDKPAFTTKFQSNSLLRFDDNNMHSLQGIVMPGTESFNDGLNLREWLKSEGHKMNKSERLHIFKQILELVDFSHSKGVFMQDLRPSGFTLLPLNKIKYNGSYGQQMSDNRAMTCNVIRKRPPEQDIFACQSLSTKKQKYSEGTAKMPMESRNKGSMCIDGSSSQHAFTEEQKFTSATTQLEEKWYCSPEVFNGGVCTYSSNIYSLGILLFELLCNIESLEAHSTVMLDLCRRILPPKFLSQNAKEAGFCLWLLHPDPSCRPNTRMILESEFMRELEESSSGDNIIVSEENVSETEQLLHFLISVEEEKKKQEAKVTEQLKYLNEDIKELERYHSYGNGSVFPLAQMNNPDVRENMLHFQDSSNSDINRSIPRSFVYEARFMSNMNQLENSYFSMRNQVLHQKAPAVERIDKSVTESRWRLPHLENVSNEIRRVQGSDGCLGSFFEGLCKFAPYSKFQERGILRNRDLLSSANVICALSFDRDEDYIAAGGITKKIKIFDLNAISSDSTDIQYPVVEMSNKSKLSCVCWNSYIKNHLATTDYDGVVQMWDAGTGQPLSRYMEHQKRAWSVHFSVSDPKMFASGSDDCSVKLWNISERNSLGTIFSPANVCCVQFSAYSTNHLFFGAADYKVYGYDLRNTRTPLCTLSGHGKAVSYVKFIDAQTVVSASTDNSLKLWDLKKTSSAGQSSDASDLTFKGHSNEKNFVGLSVLDGYIACGSESNEVYCYHKSLPVPITSYQFESIDPISGQSNSGDNNGQFVSSVCWRKKSNMLVAANSVGIVKLLQMV